MNCIRLVIQFKKVNHIHPVRMVNLLCYRGNFINMTFIDAKTKYRTPYLLDVSDPYLQNHIKSSLGHLHNVCRRDV